MGNDADRAGHRKLLVVLSLSGSCAVFALLFLPFVDKAFHMDDRAFLWTAHQMRPNPLLAVPAPLTYMGRLIPSFLPYELPIMKARVEKYLPPLIEQLTGTTDHQDALEIQGLADVVGDAEQGRARPAFAG